MFFPQGSRRITRKYCLQNLIKNVWEMTEESAKIIDHG